MKADHSARHDRRARAIRTLEEELRAGPVEDLYPFLEGSGPAALHAQALEALRWLAPSLEARDGFGAPLHDRLLRLARGPLAPGLRATVGRRRLLAELLLQLARPGRINQGHKGTCAVTCVESWLARSQPAEYARILVGLCGPVGGVGLRNGDALVRDEDALDADPREARRSPLSRLFQAAAMEAACPEADYDNRLDIHRALDPSAAASAGQGLGTQAFDRLLEAITGEPWSLLTDQHAKMAAALGLSPEAAPSLERDGPDRIARALAAGDGVFVTLAGLDLPVDPAEPLLRLPHKVRVVRLGEARVEYEDPLDPEAPWIPLASCRVEDDEGLCSMDRADFFRLLVELSTPARHDAPAAGGRA